MFGLKNLTFRRGSQKPNIDGGKPIKEGLGQFTDLKEWRAWQEKGEGGAFEGRVNQRSIIVNLQPLTTHIYVTLCDWWLFQEIIFIFIPRTENFFWMILNLLFSWDLSTCTKPTEQVCFLIMFVLCFVYLLVVSY